MIVFLDWNFSGLPTKGIDILKEIRKTSLLYVIMMSANPVTSFPAQSVIDMMNEENFFFRSQPRHWRDVWADWQDTENWVTRFDCILEQWLINHPECSDKIAFRTFDQTITWQKYWKNFANNPRLGNHLKDGESVLYLSIYWKLGG